MGHEELGGKALITAMSTNLNSDANPFGDPLLHTSEWLRHGSSTISIHVVAFAEDSARSI